MHDWRIRGGREGNVSQREQNVLYFAGTVFIFAIDSEGPESAPHVIRTNCFRRLNGINISLASFRKVKPESMRPHH